MNFLKLLKNTAITLSLFAALALGAAGSADPGSFARTQAYELFTGGSEKVWCSLDDAARTTGREPHLRGPHFSVSILCSYAGDAVPEVAAAESRELGALLTLADGTDLLLAQVALAPMYQPEVEAGAVTVWVQAGAERLELAELPDNWDFVAVTVPAGEDAVLWVEDEGRAQGLDLRTTARVDPVVSYYNGIPADADSSDAYSYREISIGNGTEAYRVTCGGGVRATRHTWMEGAGWAPAGEVFLEVYVSWCDDFEDILRWELDREAAITVLQGDEVVGPLSWNERLDEEEERLFITALFTVPADQAESALTFVPVGDLVNLSDGGDFRFNETLDATEWTFDF